MTEQQTPYPFQDPRTAERPLPTTTETVEPTPGKTRRWLAGAMLVTVGLVAGSGATYAFTSNPTSDVPGTTSGYGGGGFGGPPPGGAGPGNGVLPDQQGQSDQGTTRSTGSQPA